MSNINVVSALIGATLCAVIFVLTRRDHISPFVAARWLFVACLVFIVSFFPQVVDKVGAYLGIGYPPILPVLIAISAALIKILLMDIERQKMAVKLDRLVQKVAILEQSLNSQREAKN